MRHSESQFKLELPKTYSRYKKLLFSIFLDIRTKHETKEIENLVHSIHKFVTKQNITDSKKIIGKSAYIKKEIDQS